MLFSPLTLESIGVTSCLLAKTNAPVRFAGKWPMLRYWLETVFTYKDNVILTTDPLTPIIYLGHLLTNSNVFVRFEGQASMGCLVIDRNLCLSTRTMWPWPLTLKSIGLIYWPRPMYLCSLRAKGPCVVKLLIDCRFYLQGQCNLDLWPLDPKIDRGHLLAKTNAPTMFKGLQPMGCQVIDLKPFLPTNSTWQWPLTPSLQIQ